MAMEVGQVAGPQAIKKAHGMPFIVAASGTGTMIEWYDFYIFGSLATLMAGIFFAPGSGAFLLTLATFAAGFAVRPFGAVVFGRIGDFVGRKYAFLLTITIMGLGTTLIGLLPTYAQVGVIVPITLLGLRVIQGLALGGEYGGAVVYVAEHAPDGKRGYWTSFIQTTATLGLFLSLGIVLILKAILGIQAFNSWGWRIPFLLSSVLVAASLFIRWKLRETPLFARLKAAGRTSKAPLREALASWANWKLILLALFGATAGQAVVWYTGQFYALFFMQTSLKMDATLASIIILVALALATPFLVEFFPARIRYTALSVPYHLGNGEFGGFTPVIATAIVVWTGNIFLFLIWCIAIPVMTLLVGLKYLPETKDTKIWEEVTPAPSGVGAPTQGGATAEPVRR